MQKESTSNQNICLQIDAKRPAHKLKLKIKKFTSSPSGIWAVHIAMPGVWALLGAGALVLAQVLVVNFDWPKPQVFLAGLQSNFVAMVQGMVVSAPFQLIQIFQTHVTNRNAEIANQNAEIANQIEKEKVESMQRIGWIIAVCMACFTFYAIRYIRFLTKVLSLSVCFSAC